MCTEVPGYAVNNPGQMNADPESCSWSEGAGENKPCGFDEIINPRPSYFEVGQTCQSYYRGEELSTRIATSL